MDVKKGKNKQIRKKKKTIFMLSFLIIFVISSTGLLIYYFRFYNNSNGGFYMESGHRLDILDTKAYSNGTVKFTAFANFTWIDFGRTGNYENLKDKPYPNETLYVIRYVYVTLESGIHLIQDFNETLGEILPIANVTIIFGDLNLSANEIIKLQFNTLFPLNAGDKLYVGVFVNYDLTDDLYGETESTAVLIP